MDFVVMAWIEVKIELSEEDIPKQWYNIQADLKRPSTRRCIRPQDSRSGQMT